MYKTGIDIMMYSLIFLFYVFTVNKVKVVYIGTDLAAEPPDQGCGDQPSTLKPADVRDKFCSLQLYTPSTTYNSSEAV